MNIIKNNIVFILLLLLTPSALPQHGNISKVENNLYCRALFASLEKMDRDWGKFTSTAQSNRVPTNYHKMIVEKNPHITEGLPARLGDYQVEYLEPKELIERYKRLRKEYAILIAAPMINEEERLKIRFIVYWISYKKGRLMYALSEWSEVYFRYECESRKYVIDEVKLGGI